MVGTCRTAIAKAGLSAADIAAIGITNQRETVVVWDRQDRQADPQRHRLAGPPHRADSAQALKKQGLEPTVHAQDRPAARSLFLRHQDRLAARQGEGRAQAGRKGRTACRHDRQFPDLAADRRQGARHRRHQCLAHAALRHREEPLGRRTAGASCACPRAMLPEVQRLRGRFRRDRQERCSAPRSRSSASPATSRRRRSARPASSPA